MSHPPCSIYAAPNLSTDTLPLLLSLLSIGYPILDRFVLHGFSGGGRYAPVRFSLPPFPLRRVASSSSSHSPLLLLLSSEPRRSSPWNLRTRVFFVCILRRSSRRDVGSSNNHSSRNDNRRTLRTTRLDLIRTRTFSLLFSFLSLRSPITNFYSLGPFFFPFSSPRTYLIPLPSHGLASLLHFLATLPPLTCFFYLFLWDFRFPLHSQTPTVCFHSLLGLVSDFNTMRTSL